MMGLPKNPPTYNLTINAKLGRSSKKWARLTVFQTSYDNLMSSLPGIIFVFLLTCVVLGLIIAGLLLFKKIPMMIGKLFKGTLDKEDGWDRNAFD